MNPLKHKMANEWMRQEDASPEEALDTWNTMEAEVKANRAMVQESRTMVADASTEMEQSPDSFLRPKRYDILTGLDVPAETLEDWDVSFRNPNAQGGRIRLGKAGIADPASNVKVGDDLGSGVFQQHKAHKITYNAQHGTSYSMSKKGGIPSFDTLKKAQNQRKKLIKKFGEIAFLRPEKQKYTWEKFNEDPEFQEFFKQELKENPNIKAVAKKYKLGEDNLEELFKKVREEVQTTQSIKKGTTRGKGKGKIVNVNTIRRLDQKFNYTYKPRLGTVGTKELARYLDISTYELSKLMSYMGKSPPDPLYAKTKAGIREESVIRRANKLQKRLEELEIGFKQMKPNPIRSRITPGKKSVTRWRFEVNPKKIEELSKFKLFKKVQDYPPKGKKDIFTSLSKNSDEYKKFGYSKDRTAVNELSNAMNRSFDAMNDAELKNFIKKNPKLRNLVEMTFDGITGDFDKVSIDKMSADQIRQSSRMEVDHIRGRATVKFDDATKKILDGLNIEYPRNLYVIPRGINGSVKRNVENFVADYPNKTEKIKNINKVFNDSQISYWNRTTNRYGGYKPLKTAVDTTHLGTELEFLLDQYKSRIDNEGIERATVKSKDKLLAKLKQVNESRMGKPNSALNELMQRTGAGIDPQLLFKAVSEELFLTSPLAKKAGSLARKLGVEFEAAFIGL